MIDALNVQPYQESRIDDEPILGPVLTLPNGSIKPLTWFERVLFKLHLVDAKSLAARYSRPLRS